MAETPSSTQHVLIIGGGLAGVCVATTLAKATTSKNCETEPPRITILEPKDYVELHWAAIRGLFDPSVAESMLIPLADGLAAYPTINHIRAKAVSLSIDSETRTNHATLDNGDVVPFSVCVVATGSEPSYEPLRSTTPARTDRLAELAAAGEALKIAPSALIIGGGLIGAELAGDLAAYAAADKTPTDVTLVHAHEHLAPPLREGSAAKLRKKLEAIGVVVVTGQHAQQVEADDGSGEMRWMTEESGDPLLGETIVKTVGVSPTTGGDLLRDLVGTEGVDKKGWILTDKYGRVEGGGGVLFSLGDCVKGDFKSGVNIMASKDVLSTNIRAALDFLRDAVSMSEAESKMKHFPKVLEAVGITAGPSAGVMQTPWFTDTWLLPMFKNKTMFIFRGKGQMGF